MPKKEIKSPPPTFGSPPGKKIPPGPPGKVKTPPLENYNRAVRPDRISRGGVFFSGRWGWRLPLFWDVLSFSSAGGFPLPAASIPPWSGPDPKKNNRGYLGGIGGPPPLNIGNPDDWPPWFLALPWVPFSAKVFFTLIEPTPEFIAHDRKYCSAPAKIGSPT